MKRDYSARSKNRAQYLPAVQGGTHRAALGVHLKSRGGVVPPCLDSASDLDWLDANNPLFSTDRALFSAGQFIGGTAPDGICRKRPGVTILCDSGGLQYGLGRSPWQGDVSREWTLGFLEANADEAITLDIPTKAIAAGPAVFGSFAACLAITLENNTYFHRHRTADVRFLSVLQGTSPSEAVAWYDAVKAQPFEGWAFAGALNRDYLHMAEMLMRLIADGLLGPDRNRIHVLGVSRPTDAVMLSAFQRALRDRLGDPELQITFDTSSPSKIAVTGQAYGYPEFTTSKFQLSMFRPPSSHVHSGRPYVFPVSSSRISEKLTIADLCVASSNRQHGWDVFGVELIVNHNTESLFRAIDDANAILELPTMQAGQFAPAHLVRAYNAVRTMFGFPNPLGHLARSKSDFAKL